MRNDIAHPRCQHLVNVNVNNLLVCVTVCDSECRYHAASWWPYAYEDVYICLYYTLNTPEDTIACLKLFLSLLTLTARNQRAATASRISVLKARDPAPT